MRRRGINQIKNLGLFLPSINNHKHMIESNTNPKIKSSIIFRPVFLHMRQRLLVELYSFPMPASESQTFSFQM